jgi:hypothetical protein
MIRKVFRTGFLFLLLQINKFYLMVSEFDPAERFYNSSSFNIKAIR